MWLAYSPSSSGRYMYVVVRFHFNAIKGMMAAACAFESPISLLHIGPTPSALCSPDSTGMCPISLALCIHHHHVSYPASCVRHACMCDPILCHFPSVPISVIHPLRLYVSPHASLGSYRTFPTSHPIMAFLGHTIFDPTFSRALCYIACLQFIPLLVPDWRRINM